MLQGCALAESGGPWPLNLLSGEQKILFFHTNHMLATLDFTGSEHCAM